MEVLFRAEVIKIGSMAESRIKKLTQIENKFYCIGFESLLDGQYAIVDKDGNYFECKYDTRAIHFSDMLDSQENKIFASLSEDGKGGDIANYDEKGIWILIYIQNAFMWVNIKDIQKTNNKEPVSFLRLKPNRKIKVIGIQQ